MFLLSKPTIEWTANLTRRYTLHAMLECEQCRHIPPFQWNDYWKRAGKCTRLPLRVCTACAGGADVGGGALMLVAGFNVLVLVLCCCVSSLFGVSKIYSGFNRSIVTVTSLPLMMMTKFLSVRLTTLYGPSYGFWSGVRTASCRRKTEYTSTDPVEWMMFVNHVEKSVLDVSCQNAAVVTQQNQNLALIFLNARKTRQNDSPKRAQPLMPRYPL